MKKYLSIIILTLSLTINAQVPANYYDSAAGYTGYALKTQLRNIIASSHQPHSYNDLYTAYATTDVDNYYENDGTLLDMYSEKPNGADAYNYTHNSNHCGNYSGEGDCFNREHIMPQSVFGSASPMQSDAISVVPSDGSVNGARSNYAFGEVGTATYTSTNGSKRGNNVTAGYSGTVFEPIDEFKGDIARIMFYFATRYENQVAGWNHSMLNGTSDQVYADWFKDLMIQWHNQDPVSLREIDRNNAAYNYQGNANPFINHPEWVNAIWNPIPDTQAPTAPTNLTASNTTHNSTDLTWTASTDDVGVSSYNIYQDGVLIGTTATPGFSVSGLNPNTNYDFYVIAYDLAQNSSVNSNTENITTLSGPTTLINEDFNTCTTVSTNFITFSEQSTNNWTCATQYGENNTGSMQMNGYQDNVLSKDWLITTNSIDFSQYVNEKLSVYLIHKYGTMSLELLYSTDYDGVNNPSSFTWTAMPNITIDTHDGTSTEFVQTIVDADISSLNQASYVAFKYYSNGSPTRWTVDNFVIEGDNVNSISDSQFNNSVSIYPNPTNNELHIKSITNIDSITIYNYLGKKVFFQKNTSTINISTLNKGLYLCKIMDEFGNTAIKRVIKN